MRRTTTPGLFPAGFAPARALDPIRAVDEAVRSVLAEMFGGFRSSTSPAPRIVRPSAAVEPVFADRLFGLRQAETLADGATIRVAVGTVVTPLARDLLKKKNVEIRLIGSAEVAASARGEWAFAIEDGPGWLVALRRSMLDGAGPWRELAPSVDDAVAWLGSGEGRGVLLVTTDGATAVWRACQSSGVRAAFANEPADVQRATGTLGANLIVVDPAGKSIAWIKQLATAFRRAGAPKDPFAGGIGGTP
ncbi:hypothetical protein [Paludisphaera rhizosphaerae]|uniref:hypothetical protein n=1 Tax=Paludisphaera rhizosphaerae TaxID=2711216 RepID=UPI0013EE1A4B|nr:hypothetical protein [Paludisphaera rhizosphaerae]